MSAAVSVEPMTAVLVFAIALFAAALISELAHRTVVSTTVLFLLVGFFAGPELAGAIQIGPRSSLLFRMAEVAMFAVLFTDGMGLSPNRLRHRWRLPALALGVGMPLTMLGTAAVAHLLLHLSWLHAFVLGAALAPTDPVFASAIVGRQDVPERLRSLLNIESGLNDGLALPALLPLLAVAGGHATGPTELAGDVVLGVLLGLAIPWAGHRLISLRAFAVSEKYEAVYILSLGLLVYALAAVSGVNLFLAAFAGGFSTAAVRPEVARQFCPFGETVSELLKLATVMLFGSLLQPSLLGDVPIAGYAFAAVALLAVRPVALHLALGRARLSGRERVAAYWFGPKGFASILYGVYVLRSDAQHGPALFRLIATVVGVSIVAHASTDVLVARWFSPDSRHREDSDAASAPAR